MDDPVISIERDGDVLRIRLVGEIDLSNVEQLETALQPELLAKPELLEVDFGGVTFIDSTGLRWLLQTDQAVGGYGGRVVVTRSSEAVHRLFEVTGVLDRFGTPDAD